MINLLRVPGVQQVLLKVRIAELNRTALREIGTDILGVDPSNGKLLAHLAAHGEVLSRVVEDDRITVHVRMPARSMGEVKRTALKIRDVSAPTIDLEGNAPAKPVDSDSSDVA